MAALTTYSIGAMTPYDSGPCSITSVSDTFGSNITALGVTSNTPDTTPCPSVMCRTLIFRNRCGAVLLCCVSGDTGRKLSRISFSCAGSLGAPCVDSDVLSPLSDGPSESLSPSFRLSGTSRVCPGKMNCVASLFSLVSSEGVVSNLAASDVRVSRSRTV
ncbi:unnamed protein product [Chrysodeixis includens]|uniref:Uncharacterized protein n=1 Tax=Chrysodeixis includens TaxID=689277 RepID=A0A9N8KYT3_CHRIL|nr:unnamed protein product [Chrysodeixis includens]